MSTRTACVNFQTPGNATLQHDTVLSRLQHLRHRRRRKLCAEYSIPKPARNSKAVLVVHEVVLEVVFLELAVVEWKAVA